MDSWEDAFIAGILIAFFLAAFLFAIIVIEHVIRSIF